MARSLGFALLALLCFTGVANATTVVYTKAYSSFYSAATWTTEAKLCKQLIDGLGLKNTMLNTKLALTIFIPTDVAFNTLAAKLKVSTSAVSKPTALMKQVMYYHFVTGSNGVKKVFPTNSLKAGLKLDTMYTNALTKKPYQLTVQSVNGTKAQIKSVGTTANIVKPNIKAGAGVAHVVDNVLVPMPLSLIPKF